MFSAIEGAEDSHTQGAADIEQAALTPQDVVLLIAASGSTPYVLGALQAARRSGALLVALANNPGSPLAAQADIGITLDTGPEVISGSTRLKAGTAQKIALNAFSSAVMVRLHKVYGNLMVDLKATNAKLLRRTLALTVRATGCDEATAAPMLQRCGQHVKLAIVALRAGVEPPEAQAWLDNAHGSVRAALEGRDKGPRGAP
jgi:N-acetylmuramic acid 6-phosphate etherase